MKKQSKGITLVALVVTIIILLILAGVTIAQLTKNGLLEKAKFVKQKYAIVEAKEKIELKIAYLRIEQEGKNEELTKEDLPKINNDEIDVGSTERFPVQIICEKYKFNIDENFIVTYIGEADETIVTYTTEPEGYTKQDNITIKIKITSTLGIERIEYPNGSKDINCNGKKTMAIDYNVNQNGTYLFKITDINGKETLKEVVIQKIDKENPKKFIASIEEITKDGFKIISNTEDEDETTESVKSGIEKYEYFIKKNDEETYTKYESKQGNYIVNGLNQETEYSVYVIAYDRAGNYTQTEKVKVETLGDKTYLYKSGNKYTELTGGWKFIQQSNVNYSENNEYIKIWATSSNGCVASLATNNSIDLSEFSKIKCEMNDVRDFNSAYPSYFGISNEVDSEWPDLIKELQVGNSNVKKIYEIDISDLDGKYYPTIKGAMKAYIYSIWLEK